MFYIFLFRTILFFIGSPLSSSPSLLSFFSRKVSAKVKHFFKLPNFSRRKFQKNFFRTCRCELCFSLKAVAKIRAFALIIQIFFTLFHTIFAESSHLTKHQHITSKTFSGAKPASTPSSPKIDGKHTFEQNKNTRSGKTNPLEIPDNNPRHFTPQGINKHKNSGFTTPSEIFPTKFFQLFSPPMLLFLPFNINIITNGSYKIRWFLPIIFDSFFPFVRRHTGYSTKFSKKYGQQPQKLTTQTKINQIPPQQYLIYISTYRPSFTLKLPDILPSERDLACPNYKLPPKSATKQS